MGVVWRTQSTQPSGPALSRMVVSNHVRPLTFKLIEIEHSGPQPHWPHFKCLRAAYGHWLPHQTSPTQNFPTPQEFPWVDVDLHLQMLSSQTVREAHPHIGYWCHFICTTYSSPCLLWRYSWLFLRKIKRNRSGAVHSFTPPAVVLCTRSAVDLLLVSSLIYTGTLVTVPVSVFTLAAGKPRART